MFLKSAMYINQNGIFFQLRWMCGTRDANICSNGRSTPLLPHRPMPWAASLTLSQRDGGSARWCFLGVSKQLFPIPNQTTGLQTPANRLHLFVSLTFRRSAPIRGSSEWTKPAPSSDAPGSAQTHYSGQQSSGQRFPQDPVILTSPAHSCVTGTKPALRGTPLCGWGLLSQELKPTPAKAHNYLTSADTDTAPPVLSDTVGAAMRAQGYRPLFVRHLTLSFAYGVIMSTCVFSYW